MHDSPSRVQSRAAAEIPTDPRPRKEDRKNGESEIVRTRVELCAGHATTCFERSERSSCGTCYDDDKRCSTDTNKNRSFSALSLIQCL